MSRPLFQRVIAAIAIACVPILIPGAGVAQSFDPSITGAAKDILPRYVVPESPAAALLSSSPAKAVHPGSAKDLAAALINAIDSKGRIQQGVAIEAAYTRLVKKPVSLGAYQTDRPSFALANTQLSLSSVRVSGDSASTDLAVGIRTTVFDRSDPLASLPLTKALAATSKKCLGDQPGHDAQKEIECALKAIDSLKKDFLDQHWNDASLVLAFAKGWRLKQSRFDQGSDRGRQMWGTASFPFGRRAQIIAYADWTRAAPQDTVPGYTAVGYGGRLVVGAPDFNFFAERRRERRSTEAPGLARQVEPWAGGIEFRMAPELWITAGLGANADDEPDPKSGTVILANLRWALSDRPHVKRE